MSHSKKKKRKVIVNVCHEIILIQGKYQNGVLGEGILMRYKIYKLNKNIRLEGKVFASFNKHTLKHKLNY